MAQSEENVLKIKFPGAIEYIPAVRKFIAEILQVSKFSPKFAYRTEIIVDELCNNAVTHGSLSEDASIDLVCNVLEDKVEFKIKDEGGCQEDIERLRRTVDGDQKHTENLMDNNSMPASGLGLEIVRMLSEEMRLEVDDQSLLSIHVVRKREDLPGDNLAKAQ
jgi:anti-sigma regulatory factor (Ser/Thr protein kinase)